MLSVSPRTVVIVDDNEDDVFLFTRLLQKAGLKDRLMTFGDGQEAIAYLGRVACGQIDRPLVCFIDVKMPACGGFDVLEALRASEELDRVVGIMLSSSDDRRDITKASKSGAD